jgi:FkbM family methyltransferase
MRQPQSDAEPKVHGEEVSEAPLHADLNIAKDGAEVIVRIYPRKENRVGQSAAPAASLFDSTEGNKRLLIRLYPNSCTLRLNWQDGQLLGIRIDGAFPPQHESAPISRRRVYKSRQTTKSLTLEHEPDLLPARVQFSESGAPSRLEVDRSDLVDDSSSANMAVRLEWDNGVLAGVRIQGDLGDEVSSEKNPRQQLFRVRHRENEVSLVAARPDRLLEKKLESLHDSVPTAPIIDEITFANDVVAKFFCGSKHAQHRVAHALSKEPETIDWLNQISSESVLWDVGANVGVYTVYAAMVRMCRVVAFEPAAANYFSLNRTIEINDLQDRVTAYCLSIAGSNRYDRLYLSNTDFGEAFNNFGSPTDFQGNPFVPVFSQGSVGSSLDELAVAALPFPNHIKIDVDGLEHEIVMGGGALFENSTLRSALIELDTARPDLMAGVVNRMAGCGLTWVNKDAEPGIRHCINAIFRRD